jgi:hypothetical protein
MVVREFATYIPSCDSKLEQDVHMTTGIGHVHRLRDRVSGARKDLGDIHMHSGYY